jgi:hypothetical protein
MRLQPCILTLLTASVVTASFMCGAPPPTEEQKQIVRNFQAHEEDARSKSFSMFNNSSIDIKVCVHNSPAGYLLTDSMLQQVLPRRGRE